MPDGLIQVDALSGAIQIKNDGVVISAEGTPCCCGNNQTNPCSDACCQIFGYDIFIKLNATTSTGILINPITWQGSLATGDPSAYISGVRAFNGTCSDFTRIGGLWEVTFITSNGNVTFDTVESGLECPPLEDYTVTPDTVWTVADDLNSLDPIIGNLYCCTNHTCGDLAATIFLAGLSGTATTGVATDLPDDHATLPTFTGMMELVTTPTDCLSGTIAYNPVGVDTVSHQVRLLLLGGTTYASATISVVYDLTNNQWIVAAQFASPLLTWTSLCRQFSRFIITPSFDNTHCSAVPVYVTTS